MMTGKNAWPFTIEPDTVTVPFDWDGEGDGKVCAASSFCTCNDCSILVSHEICLGCTDTVSTNHPLSTLEKRRLVGPGSALKIVGMNRTNNHVISPGWHGT